ncbi:MAG: putative Zn-dependent peptidase [Myxococcota bacterium]|jgi:predicted Zn-dependent peptidase
MITATIFLSLALASSQQQLTIGEHTFEYRVLDNGLRAYAILDAGDTTSVFMAIAAGTRDETSSTTGLAHLTEHAMFAGTATTGPDEHEKTVVSWGGESNAFTRDDYTMYYDHNFAPEHLGKVLEMEADRLRSLSLAEKPVLHERHRLDIEEEHAYQPSEGRLQQLENAVYKSHPYRHGLRDKNGHTKAPQLGVDRVKFFYDAYYHPNRTALVVVGPADPTQTLDLIEKSFGGLKSQSVSNNHYFEPELSASRSVEITSQLPRDRVVRCWLTPNISHADRAALDVLAAMLQRDEIAANVIVNVGVGGRIEQDIFKIGWSVGANDPAVIAKQTARMLTKYKLGEADASVLAEVKDLLADVYASQPMRSRPYFALAGTLAWYAAHDLTAAMVGYQAAIEAVSVEDLARVCKTYLANKKCVTVTFKGTGEEVKPLPESTQDLQAAASSAVETGDYPRALEAYTLLLAKLKDPMNQIINYAERGSIYLEMKNYDAAIADFEAGLTHFDYPAVADMRDNAIAQKKRAMRGIIE